MKISAIWATGLICLTLGAAVGVLAATYLRSDVGLRPGEIVLSEEGKAESIRKGQLASGMGAAGKKDGAGAPSVKGPLITLITKLDVLTKAPLTVTLADDQKAAVAAQISGLEALDVLSDEEAQRRYDALLEILANHKDTFVAAGVRWPGAGGGFSPPMANPFKDESNVKVLKSLQDRLTAAPAK